MIRALIVDDEELARRGLQLHLAGVVDFEVCGEAANGREAIAAVRALRPDVVFLDIQMPGTDGFEVVRALAGQDMPCIVFVTAFDQFAIDAFEANAQDYLLKPIDAARFGLALERVRESLSDKAAQSHQATLLRLISRLSGTEMSLQDVLTTAEHSKSDFVDCIQIKEHGDVYKVAAASIVSVEAAGDYLCVDDGETTHVLRGTMKALEDRLDPSMFVRIHRSVLLNKNAINRVRPFRNGEFFILLVNGREFRSGRKYKEQASRLVG